MPQILSEYYPPEYKSTALIAPIAVPMQSNLGRLPSTK